MPKLFRAIKRSLRDLVIATLEKRGYNVRFCGQGIDFPSILREATLRSEDGFFFLQIGGLDGISDDPIHQFIKDNRWRGLIVEPQLHYFLKLKETYRDVEGLSFENVLIGSADGRQRFYRLSESSPKPYHGQASLDRSLILQHLAHEPDAESWIIEEELPSLTLASLLHKHQIRRLDLLQIDAEGFDYDIIKQLDFEHLRPGLIHFEHRHLTPAKLRACIDLLESEGYLLLIEGVDITAFPRYTADAKVLCNTRASSSGRLVGL